MGLSADRLVKISPDSPYAAHALAFRARYAQWCFLMGGDNPQAVNVATFKLVSGTHVTMCSENVSRNFCAEQALHEDILPDLQGGAKIAWVFTEREPCGPSLHNCSDRLQILIDNHGAADCKVYYIWRYPEGENRKSATKMRTNREMQGMAGAVFSSVKTALTEALTTRSGIDPKELMKGTVTPRVRQM